MSDDESGAKPGTTGPPSPGPPAPQAQPAPKQDVVFIHSRCDDGDALRVIRKRDETIEVGEMRALAEGQPIHGDVVKLTRREEHDRLFDVEVLMSREEAQARAGRSGPAQVATNAYRENWDAIFGKNDEKALPN